MRHLRHIHFFRSEDGGFSNSGRIFRYSPRRFIFIKLEKLCFFRFPSWEMFLWTSGVAFFARRGNSTSLHRRSPWPHVVPLLPTTMSVYLIFNFESYSQMKEQYLFCFIELFGRIILRYFRGEGWVLADGLARTRFVDLSVDHNNSLSLSLVIPRKFPVFLFSNFRFYWRIMPAIISSLA